MNATSAIEPAALARLQKLGGAKLIAQMIDLFLDNAPQRINAARAAERTGDLNGVARAAHSLKSSAGYLGAAAVAELAARIEREASAENPDPIAPLLDELEAACSLALTDLSVQRKELSL